MTTIVSPETVDLSIRSQLDTDSLVKYMLETDDYGSLPVPFVCAEVDLQTDAKSMLRPVIVYSCGAPVQFTNNLKAWHWRFPLTLTVICMDGRTAFRMAARIGRNVAMWPWRDTDYADAKVVRIPDNSGFQRLGPGDVTNSKTSHVFVAEKTIQAATPVHEPTE